MKTVGNVLWLLICGVWISIGWLFRALIFAIPVVGLPFARQCVKLANFSLWPFGKKIIRTNDAVAFSAGSSTVR